MRNPMLEKIASVLEQAGYPLIWSDASDDGGPENLRVTLPSDEKGRSGVLIIKTEEELISMPLEDGNEYKESFVQMLTYLPFKVADGSVWEVLRVINFFNSALPTPGFVLDEGLRQVFFRYIFLRPGEEIGKDSILALVGMIVLWLDAASDSIEETASGTPMIDVIQERIEALGDLE